jgi:hypothetical protein
MACVKLNVSLDQQAARILRSRAAQIGVPASRYLSDLILEDDRRRRDLLAEEGYRLLCEETRRFVAAALPVAEETWPEWQETDNGETRSAQG